MEKELRSKIHGDVRFDEMTRRVYSVDSSIYEVMPIGVVSPKTTQDVIETVKVAAKHGVSIIPRGAATGVTGGCLGSGLIVDTSKYMNRILKIDWSKKTAVCEPGVVQDDLNSLLAEKGYRLGPSTSTGNRATVGGMLANNAAGAHSLLYGSTGENALEVVCVLANGTLKHFDRRLPPDLQKVRNEYRDEIHSHFPKIKRMASGYYLPALLDNNPCRLLAGSEGTLGITTQVTFKIVPSLKQTFLYALHFSSLEECFAAVPLLLKQSPIAIEMVDSEIIEAGKKSPTMASRLGWLKGEPAAVLAVEFLESQNMDDPPLSKDEQEDLWAVRKAGLELLLSKRSYQRALAFMEDITVPPDQLSAFMQRFITFLKSKNRSAGIYGHVGAGCMHIRPFVNLMESSDQKLMKEMTVEVSKLVSEFGGVMSGEHGDGLVRSWLNPTLFTPKLYEAMKEIKSIFDPRGLMNPGKIVDSPPLLNNLRRSPAKAPATFLDFSEEGGFALAVDMCNGNGLCRKKEGIMCPSFQATGDETDSTRARAQGLRSILLGNLKPASLTHPALTEILDLCLECKGCLKECPSQVDMAKMKAEVQYQVKKTEGASLRSRLFAHVAELNRFGSRMPKMINFINALPPTKWLLGQIGVASNRPLPHFAPIRFSEWLKTCDQPEGGEEVVLFNDTYTEFSVPEIGRAAVQVLNAMGFYVRVPKWSCCGRPLISKGFLPEARRKILLALQTLEKYKGLPILFLEPSCLSVLTHDLKGFVKPGAVSASCQSFETFVAHHQDRLALKDTPPIKIHGHCHQKSLWGTAAMHELLPNADEILAGCCGLAGSFGYEAEHYDISMKIGELKLFPAVREAEEDAMIVANGFSCRCQIEHGTKRSAFHIAEALARSLETQEPSP